MANVSRPLIALLIATVAFFALWVTALKPTSATNAANPPAPVTAPRTPATHAAPPVSSAHRSAPAATASHKHAQSTVRPHHVARQAHHVSARHPRGHMARAGHATTRTAHSVRPHAKAVHAVPNPGVAPTAAGRVGAMQRALSGRKVLALLFYNPVAADDAAVKQELATIPTRNGQVVKLAIPLSELPSYASVISQVPVNYSPTLVIIDRHHQAFELAGFVDSYELAQRIDAAL